MVSSPSTEKGGRRQGTIVECLLIPCRSICRRDKSNVLGSDLNSHCMALYKGISWGGSVPVICIRYTVEDTPLH
jgi:hypothetical protein